MIKLFTSGFLFLCLFCYAKINVLKAQTDWQRWEAAEINYEIQSDSGKAFTFDNSNLGMMALSGVKNIYYFFISDVDGDNCPFYPSCSAFFLRSVKETNILKGTLMFADRFTRDSNLFKTPNQYPLHSTGKFFDPVSGYKPGTGK